MIVPEYYETPSGKKYMKDNAKVPHKYLIEYIKCMHYLKFSTKTGIIEIEGDLTYATIKKYKGNKKSKEIIYDNIYEKIYMLLVSATFDNPVICWRPSSIYMSGCMPPNHYLLYETEDIEDLKFEDDPDEITAIGHNNKCYFG
jgi:hypothetical protein